MDIYVYANLPRNAVDRLPDPRGGDSGKDMFIEFYYLLFVTDMRNNHFYTFYMLVYFLFLHS